MEREDYKMNLKHKIDFAAVISVKNANPNGDPLNGNRPRTDLEGFGEISDVCIKRKIRNRLQDMGERIFVQSDERCDDGFKSLRDRAEGDEELKKLMKNKDGDAFAQKACETWMDVRSFGQVFAFKAKEGNVSIGIRGPVSVHPAISLMPVEVISTQITKSVNSEPGEKKGSDTMGMKHRVNFGAYVIYGSINTQLAEKTGFTDEDAEKIKKALISIFENDISSARPDGSMEVQKVYWWKHDCKTGQYSSAKVHRSLVIDREGIGDVDDIIPHIHVEPLEGLAVEEYDGR